MKSLRLALLLLISLYANNGLAKEISPEIIKQEIYNYIANEKMWESGKVEVLNINIKKPILVGDDVTGISISTNQKSLIIGLSTFRAGFMTGRGESASIWVTAMIEIYKDVVVAISPIKKGEIIPEDALGIQNLALSKLPKKNYPPLEAIIGKEAKNMLSANTAISEDLVAPPTVVKKGDKVTIFYKKGNLTITSPGEAKEKGELGKIIRVMNTATKKEIFAKIIDSTHLEVME